MNLLTVFCCLSTLAGIQSGTVTSPQIRILDVATKASETRLIPQRVEYRNSFHPSYFQQQNRYDQNSAPLKSYVIYDQYPLKIFKEWKANPPTDFPASAPQNFLELNRNAEFPPDYHFQNGQQAPPPPKPTLAYRSVYSNVIKVFDNSLDGLDRNRFPSERYVKPFEGSAWKSPIEYEPIYPQDFPRRLPYHKLPENFPKVFSPNDKFHFPSFEEGIVPPPKFFYPQAGFYDTRTINFKNENTRHPDEVELLPEVQQKKQKKAFLCGFIRVNQRQFPDSGSPCGRSEEELPLASPEYPDYSNLPNDKIPVEHRRQHFQIKRIKRSELNETYESRQKRNAFGYSSWGSPFGYDSGYDSYFGDSYQSRGNYGNSGNSGYYSNRNRNQGYRNRYSGSRYDEYDDDYQNNDDSNRGLTGYLTNGGRRYKNRNNNDDDDDNDDDNNDNNRDDDSDEEMERMNSNRRDTNDRRNNDDRDRRRNNNNNNNNNNNYDDDDYRDNRRNNNNNNNNRNNNRRYNNNNNNNNRRNNDRNDYNNNNNNNRNRYYSSSSNGYNNNNGYGSSYGGYGSNYGGYGSGGYGSSYGSNGGYGSSYGGNGGYGYGSYGNGFGSF